MPPTPSVFKTGKDARAVQIDIDKPTKTVQIGASLDVTSQKSYFGMSTAFLNQLKFSKEFYLI
jgi:hypothetical protein